MAVRSLIPLVLLCIILVPVPVSLASRKWHFKWEVGYIYWSPDCQENIMIGINGRFPGPTIRAKAGDTIQVELKNMLPTEGLVIHWHGVKQVYIYIYIFSHAQTHTLSLSLSTCLFVFCFSPDACNMWGDRSCNGHEASTLFSSVTWAVHISVYLMVKVLI